MWPGFEKCCDFEKIFLTEERVCVIPTATLPTSVALVLLNSASQDVCFSLYLWDGLLILFPPTFFWKNKAHTVALNFHHHPDYLLLPPNRAFQVAKDGRKNKVESGHPFRNQLTQLPSPQREHNLLGRQGIFFSSGFLIRVVKWNSQID